MSIFRVLPLFILFAFKTVWYRIIDYKLKSVKSKNINISHEKT